MIVAVEHDSESNQECENFDEGNIKTSQKKNYLATKTVKTTIQSKKASIPTVTPRPSPAYNRPKIISCKILNNMTYLLILYLAMEKVKITGHMSGPRRVGLSRSAPTRPLSPVKLKKFD